MSTDAGGGPAWHHRTWNCVYCHFSKDAIDNIFDGDSVTVDGV